MNTDNFKTQFVNYHMFSKKLPNLSNIIVHYKNVFYTTRKSVQDPKFTLK